MGSLLYLIEKNESFQMLYEIMKDLLYRILEKMGVEVMNVYIRRK